MVFGERKGGRAAAMGLLLGIPLLVLAVAWYPGGRHNPGPPETITETLTEQVSPPAGGPGPTARAGWRKASPITRGQDLGLRFRPDERAPAYGEVIAPGGGQAEPREQANFRPLAPRRKPTYEELQAREQTPEPWRPPMPPAPYPVLPPPYPVAPW